MRTREGVFERANGGTLLLDEITEMPLDLQSRLLRVLETKRLNRVGGSADLPVDVRVIASTNRSPAQAFEEGRLREDIYYRLAVVTISCRRCASAARTSWCWRSFSSGELNLRNGTRKRLSEELRARFLRHRWPGNVRELRNAVERAYILCDGELNLSEQEMPTLRDAAEGAAMHGDEIQHAHRRDARRDRAHVHSRDAQAFRGRQAARGRRARLQPEDSLQQAARVPARAACGNCTRATATKERDDGNHSVVGNWWCRWLARQHRDAARR